MKSTTIALTRLSADPANLREHNERSIEAIMASLRRFGQQRPIVIDKKGSVIAGNGTLEAARRLGWKAIAVVVSDLLGAERIGYAIADNRTAELSSWNNEALRSVLGEFDADLQADSGFAAGELEALLGASGGTSLQPDEVPEPPKIPVSRRGDLWVLGNQRLLCGDCTIQADVVKLMNGRRAVLFATDPPYLVDYDGTNHPQSFSNGKNKDWSDTYGKSWDDADGNSDLYERFIDAAVAHAIAPEAAWYCWHASRRQAMLEAAWIRAGAKVHCQIIWAKNRPVLTRTWYMWQHEPCLFGWVKKPKRAEKDILSTVWSIDTIPNGDERPDHPTPKPLETFAIPMRQHTEAGDVCYEPFSGSGTQIIVAEQLGRRCCAMEIEPRYVDVAVMRWQTLTGKAARLENGRTFDQLRAKPRPQPVPGTNDRCRSSQKASVDIKAAHSFATAPIASATSKPIDGRPGKARRRRPAPAGTAATGNASVK